MLHMKCLVSTAIVILMAYYERFERLHNIHLWLSYSKGCQIFQSITESDWVHD